MNISIKIQLRFFWYIEQIFFFELSINEKACYKTETTDHITLIYENFLSLFESLNVFKVTFN